MRRSLVLLSLAAALVVGTIAGQEPPAAKPKSSGEVITIKLLIAEVPEKTEGQDGAEPLDLTKPGEQIVAQIEGLAKQGRARRIQRFEISAYEEHAAQIQFGETVPALTGIHAAGPRGWAPTYTMTDIGTIVSITPRLEAEGQIVLDLIFQSSRLEPQESVNLQDGPQSFRPTGTIKSSMQTTIRVAAGRPTVLTKFETTGEPDAFKHVAIVTAVRAGAPSNGD